VIEFMGIEIVFLVALNIPRMLELRVEGLTAITQKLKGEISI